MLKQNSKKKKKGKKISEWKAIEKDQIDDLCVVGDVGMKGFL